MQTIKFFQNIKIDENNKQLMKSQKMNKKKHIRFKVSNSSHIITIIAMFYVEEHVLCWIF